MRGAVAVSKQGDTAQRRTMAWSRPRQWQFCVLRALYMARRLRPSVRLRVSIRFGATQTRAIPTNRAKQMKQSIGYVAVVVQDYDDAIKFYVDTLGFRLVEDTFIAAQNKRWVLVTPPGSSETKLLLARAVGAEQSSRIGNQTGGRVFLFLHTDNFWRDFDVYKSKGVVFVREPVEESYGTVAVFQDLYGNLWDLLQIKQ